MSSSELSEEMNEPQTWIEWFCALRGHEYFCEIDPSYIGSVGGSLQRLLRLQPDEVSLVAVRRCVDCMFRVTPCTVQRTGSTCMGCGIKSHT